MPQASAIGDRNWRGVKILALLDRPWVQFVLLLAVLLLLLPPDGVLTDNEENYFQLAAKTAGVTLGGDANSAVFDASRHRYVNEILLGTAISLTSFETMQIVTRTLAAIGFAFLLPLVFRLFALSILDSAIIVVIFASIGQSLMGDEWIFHGFEAKVIAYGFVLAALYLVRTRRDLLAMMALCAIATYFHFLVGIFWFSALLLLRLIDDRNDLKRVLSALAVFIVATAPLTGTIIWTRVFADAGVVPTDMPTPDVIFSIIREPWHAAPFISRYNFVFQWLPGFLFAGAMLAGCIFVALKSRDERQRRFAIWIACLLAYLFLALIPTYIERETGAMGKFYPFRPSSLILLLWLALAASWFNGLLTKRQLGLKLLILALVLPGFLGDVMLRIYHDIDMRASLASDKKRVVDYVRNAATTGAVVVLDPTIEQSFLDFERRTQHPTLIAWKFAPTNDPELREWYRRMEFRKSLFRDGCPRSSAYRVDFVLTKAADADALSQSCGPIVLETEHWRLLKLSPAVR